MVNCISAIDYLSRYIKIMNNTEWRNHLERAIEEGGWNMKTFSLSIGAGETTIRDIIKRGRKPNIELWTDICEGLGVLSDDLIYGTRERTVLLPISGYVLAGTDDISIQDDLSSTDFPDTIPLPKTKGRAVCVEVRGTSMSPAYRPKDKIVYSTPEHDLKNHLSKDYVVRLKVGSLHLKKVTAGSNSNVFTLNSYNDEIDPMINQRIDWAAPVEWVFRG